jgi:hypothetical protein
MAVHAPRAWQYMLCYSHVSLSACSGKMRRHGGRYARSAQCATCLLPRACVLLLRAVFPTRDGAHAYLRSGLKAWRAESTELSGGGHSQASVLERLRALRAS